MVKVRFKHYREYLDQRILVNDTVMGLLAGSKLSEQLLSLSEGSTALLGDMYPGIQDINRFNLPVAKAREVLDDAENLLVILAVPQILALHEDLMIDMLGILGSSGQPSAAQMHEKFEEETGLSFPSEELALFHLIRLARNEHIHNGGVARPHFAQQISELPQEADDTWTEITDESFPVYKAGDPVILNNAFLVGTLAVTRRLASIANKHLAQVIPVPRWADLVVHEWSLGERKGNKNQQWRSIRGLAKRFYAAINIPENELEAAFERYLEYKTGSV